MGVITTGSTPRALFPGVNSWFGTEYNQYPKEHDDLFDPSTTKNNFDIDVSLTGFGIVPIKPEGQNTQYGTSGQGFEYIYRSDTYSHGYIVTEEEVDDNKYPEVAKGRASGLAFAFHTTKNMVAANVYDRAFNSSYTYGDGSELISTSHSTEDGTQSNRLPNDVDLNEAALEDMCILIGGMTTSKGLPIGLTAKSLHVANANGFKATRILNSVLQSDTADNNLNAIRYLSAIPEGIKVNHYFSDPDAFFIRTNCPNGLKLITRKPLTFTMDGDFDTGNRKHKGTTRYVAGCTDWRAIVGTPGK